MQLLNQVNQLALVIDCSSIAIPDYTFAIHITVHVDFREAIKPAFAPVEYAQDFQRPTFMSEQQLVACFKFTHKQNYLSLNKTKRPS